VSRVTPKEGGGYVVDWKASGEGGEGQLEVGLVMMATGREPKSKGIGLEVRSREWAYINYACTKVGPWLIFALLLWQRRRSQGGGEGGAAAGERGSIGRGVQRMGKRAREGTRG
jgi:hypothetical protein